jgi:type II secretory pathway component PulM
MNALATLRARWAGLDARSRRMALIGSALGAGLLVFALVWQPAMREQQRLASRLAALKQDEVRLQTMAAEARGLLATPVGKVATDLAVAHVESLAREVGGEGIAVSAAPGGQVRLMSAATPFPAWWALVDELHRRHGVVLTRLELSPKPDAKDQVAFDMVLGR